MKKIAVLIMVVMAVLSLAACNLFGGSDVGVYEYKTDNYIESTGDYSPTSDVSVVQINWVAGNVRVVEGNVSKVNVRETAVGESAKVHYYYRVSNGTLSIAFAKNGTTVSKISKDLTVTVPKGKEIDLEVESVSATVHAELSTMGKMRVETVSGRAECKVTELNKAEFETVSGSVNMIADHVSTTSVETVSGNVSLSYKQMFQSLDVESVSGGATITMPHDASFTLDVSTESGSVSTGDYACTISGKRYIVGKGDAEIKVETVSGNVNLKKAA